MGLRYGVIRVIFMQKSIMAALTHVASSKEQNRQNNCPKGSDSWCGDQRYNNTALFNDGKDSQKMCLSMINLFLLNYAMKLF